MIRGGWASILTFALGASGLSGQTPLPDQGPGGIQGSQPALEVAAVGFARVWAGGDPGAIGAFMAHGDISLHLVDTFHRSLSYRQVVAALRSFLERHETEKARVVRASEVGGTPPRGFAEIAWEAVTAGTVEEISYTVYVGFVLEDEDWRVTEVRVMR